MKVISLTCGESKKKKQVEANTVKELMVELELSLAQLQVRLVFNLHRDNLHGAKMVPPLGRVNNAYVRICGLGDNTTCKMHSERENLKTGTNLLGRLSVIFRPLVLGNYNYCLFILCVFLLNLRYLLRYHVMVNKVVLLSVPQGRTVSAY